MQRLAHLIYASTAVDRFGEPELVALLCRAREANARVGVTGMLLYVDGSFFQVLEGEPDAVERQFAKIAADPRHSGIVTIIKEPIAKRSFGEWTMGFAAMSPEECGRVAGLNDFFREATVLARLGSGRAKKLVAAFGEGRWRSRLAGAVQPPPVQEAR